MLPTWLRCSWAGEDVEVGEEEEEDVLEEDVLEEVVLEEVVLDVLDVLDVVLEVLLVELVVSDEVVAASVVVGAAVVSAVVAAAAVSVAASVAAVALASVCAAVAAVSESEPESESESPPPVTMPFNAFPAPASMSARRSPARSGSGSKSLAVAGIFAGWATIPASNNATTRDLFIEKNFFLSSYAETQTETRSRRINIGRSKKYRRAAYNNRPKGGWQCANHRDNPTFKGTIQRPRGNGTNLTGSKIMFGPSDPCGCCLVGQGLHFVEFGLSTLPLLASHHHNGRSWTLIMSTMAVSRTVGLGAQALNQR